MNELAENHQHHQRTNLECLPAELFELISQYLSGEDVIQGFSSLNQHFDRLISTTNLKTFDIFRIPTRRLADSKKYQRFICLDSLISLKFDNKLEQDDSSDGKTEFLFYFLIDQKLLNNHLTYLMQIIFIRPIIDSKICFPDVLLETFFVYSTSDKIILRKVLSSRRISNLIICNVQTLRSFLDNYGGVYDHWLAVDEHSHLDSIISRVEHLKLYVDHYESQWPRLSSLIIESIVELSLIITDSNFEDIDGNRFSLLFPNLSAEARLHFYLQVYNQNFIWISMELIVQSFQSEFYKQHQSIVSVISNRRSSARRISALRIFTSPLCISQLTLMENDEVIDAQSASNITRLVVESSYPSWNYNRFFMTGNSNRTLSHLKSIEFVASDAITLADDHFPLLLNVNLQKLQHQIRHLHLNQYSISFSTNPNLFSLNWMKNLHFLEITDNSASCKCLNSLNLGDTSYDNILHLNISGSSHLNNTKIKQIRSAFPRLQTLRFQFKFSSPSTTQLNVIGFEILTTLECLRYLHVRFLEDNLLIMTMIPSENQLGEWLGHNQRHFAHAQAIQLNRKEFAVWL